MDYFNDLITSLLSKSKTDLAFIYENLIHPYSFLKFCKFVISRNPDKPLQFALKHNKYLQSFDLNLVKDNDLVFIDSLSFNFFIAEIIDKLNKPIIIVTARENLPQITLSAYSEYALNHRNISLWFAQNPIYNNSKKYCAIPYGLRLMQFGGFAVKSRILIDTMINSLTKEKIRKLSNLPVRVHGHLSETHIRKKYKEFGINTGKILSLSDFYKIVSESEFLISTTGDRDDCYRHYESIVLGTIPISNVANQYKNIFENNMIYADSDQMLSMITNTFDIQYNTPNRNIVCTAYWKNILDKKINQINNI